MATIETTIAHVNVGDVVEIAPGVKLTYEETLQMTAKTVQWRGRYTAWPHDGGERIGTPARLVTRTSTVLKVHA